LARNMLDEEKILADADIEDKVDAQHRISIQVATRRFIEESCSLAKMLPPQKKLLFVMHFSHGYSLDEIADLCGVTTNAVTKRLKAITEEINTMRTCLKEKDGDGKTNKSTTQRIESYFRREKNRRRRLRRRQHITENL